jgi:hypothetical protein
VHEAEGFFIVRSVRRSVDSLIQTMVVRRFLPFCSARKKAAVYRAAVLLVGVMLALILAGCDGTGSDSGCQGKKPPIPEERVPVIEVDPLEINFGTVALGVRRAADPPLMITNRGTADLLLEAVFLETDSNPSFAIDAPPETMTVSPDMSVTVGLSFEPEALGAASGVLRIDSNDPELPTVAVTLAGTGVLDPDLEIPLGECRAVSAPAGGLAENDRWIAVTTGAVSGGRCYCLAIEAVEIDPPDAEIHVHVSLGIPVPRNPVTDEPEADWSGERSVLLCAADLQPGVYYVLVENRSDADASLELCATLLDAGVPYRRGFIDGDGDITLSDALFLLEYLFLSGAVPGCLASADTNADLRITISDGVRLLHHIFGFYGPLPEPFEECGCDATFTGLTCESFPLCAGEDVNRR